MKFGFVFHLFSLSELKTRGMSTDMIPCGFNISDNYVKDVVEKGAILECGTDIHIDSTAGGSCTGKEWIIPLTARGVLVDQSLTLDMTARACEMAAEWGAEIVGLGLFLGKVGGRGKNVRARVNMPVTVGDSYLVFNAVQILNKLLGFFELDPQKERVSIYGFPSTTGVLIAEYLLSLGMKITLIARQTKYIQRILTKISGKYPPSINLVPSIEEAQKESRIILAAGSGEQIIDVDEFSEPMIVIDVSFPRNVNKDSSSVLVVDAGVVAFPRTHLESSGFAANQVLSCLAELITLSLEGKKEDYSLGKNVTVEKIIEIGRLAGNHGFMEDTLYNFGRPIELEHLYRFKKQLK